MFLAVNMAMAHTAFGDLIIRVGLVIAEEQMVWIPARRIVAAMQNMSAWRNGAMMYEP